MAAYRAACPTMTGRSDVYVGFFRGWAEVTGARRCARLHLRRSLDAATSTADICASSSLITTVSTRPSQCMTSMRPRTGVSLSCDLDIAAEKQGRLWWPIQVAASVPMTPERCAWSRRRTPNLSWPHGTRSLGSPIGRRRRLMAHRISGRPGAHRGSERPLPFLEDPDTSTRVGIGVATGADGAAFPASRDRWCAVGAWR